MDTPTALETQVTCLNPEGVELQGRLVRLGYGSAVFELFHANLGLRVSDVLTDFRITSPAQLLYSGQAIISNLVPTGTGWVCEVKLDESGLSRTFLTPSTDIPRPLRAHFDDFLHQWQAQYRVRREFKETLADFQSFLADLHLWMERLELEIRSSPSADRLQLERKVIDELAEPVVRAIDSFIERFEAIAETLEEDLQPVHRFYLRRQLHPLLLCSPFAYRAFHKPLGYAGDYEVVDMMMRSPCEGGSLFAKLINVWLLGQAPAQAHRHRVAYLATKLLEESLRLRSRGQRTRFYNLGCGPAAEIQAFLKDQALSNSADFTLLDFNEETLTHTSRVLNHIKQTCGRSAALHFVKRSVQQLLKQSAKTVPRTAETQYDMVYCAGLFDYLPTPTCQRLMSLFYDLLAPGGLLVATNVSDAMNQSRPFRYSMEYILDWHLIYRNGSQMASLAPRQAAPDDVKVLAEGSGVNVFIEVRKPAHG